MGRWRSFLGMMVLGAAVAVAPLAHALTLTSDRSAEPIALERGGASLGEVPAGAPTSDGGAGLLLEDFAGGQHPMLSATGNGLQLSLSVPDSGLSRFLFSTRPQLGITFDQSGITSRASVGVSWGIFDSDTLFASIGISGGLGMGGGPLTLDAPHPRSGLGGPMQFHGGLELGYHVGGGQSLFLSLDRGSGSDYSDRSDGYESLKLHYGYRF